MNIEQAQQIAKRELFKSYTSLMCVSDFGKRSINLKVNVFNVLNNFNLIVYENSHPTYLGAVVFISTSH